MKKLSAITITLTAIGVAVKVRKNYKKTIDICSKKITTDDIDIKDLAEQLSNQYQKSIFLL